MEMLEIGRAVEGIEGPKAKERQKELGKTHGSNPSGKFPEGSKGEVRDKVAAAVGVSGKTYEKAKQVAKAAEEQPDKFGDLPASRLKLFFRNPTEE